MLFLFRSAPEVEKRIHSKLFRKFLRSRGTKEPAYITVINFTNLTNWRHIDAQIISIIHLLNLISCSWCQYIFIAKFVRNSINGTNVFFLFSFQLVCLGDILPRKKCFFYGFGQNEGGPCPIFLAHFQKV